MALLSTIMLATMVLRSAATDAVIMLQMRTELLGSGDNNSPSTGANLIAHDKDTGGLAADLASTSGWSDGPLVGPNPGNYCFLNASQVYEKQTFYRMQDAQSACKEDVHCSFVWSPFCMAKHWIKCNRPVPMENAGDESSCTSVKVEVPKTAKALDAKVEHGAAKATVNFQSGTLGIVLGNNGHVVELSDGQAKAKGVQVGWKVLEVNGASYNFELFSEAYTSGDPYAVSFEMEQALETKQALKTLVSYWDDGSCGPLGDDYHRWWCLEEEGKQLNCKPVVAVDRSICPSGEASFLNIEGEGSWDKKVLLNGCAYAFYAHYACRVVDPEEAKTRCDDFCWNREFESASSEGGMVSVSSWGTKCTWEHCVGCLACRDNSTKPASLL